jgi:hypothetical protein
LLLLLLLGSSDGIFLLTYACLSLHHGYYFLLPLPQPILLQLEPLEPQLLLDGLGRRQVLLRS